MDMKATVARLTYKPGWSFKVAGPGGAYLCVYARTANSLDPSSERTTQHQFPLPNTTDVREFMRWVRDRLVQVETHELCEFLRLDGRAPFWPHHQDEGSPYEPVERWEHP